MKKIVVLAALAFAVSNAAQAEEAEGEQDSGGFFGEPMVTYQMGDGDVDIAGDDDSQDIEGFGVGARIGMHANEVFFLAADGRYSWLESGSADAKSWNVAPVLGAQMPHYGLRIWGSYVMAGEFDPGRNDSNLNFKYKDPEGYRVGAGIKFKSVSLNGEYQKVTYDTLRLEAGDFTGDVGSLEFEDESWIASVSFPMAL